jgi:hypothetical protein
MHGLLDAPLTACHASPHDPDPPLPGSPNRAFASPARLLGCWPLLSQNVQHLHAEEGELTVLNELTQVCQTCLSRVRDLLQWGNTMIEDTRVPRFTK